MSSEQKLFIALLRDHVHNTASACVPDNIDWDALYECAQRQSLLGVCYAQLKRLSVPAEPLRRFHSGFFSDVYASANQRAFTEDILARFCEAGISCLPFKGWLVKRCWPEPALRTMGDVDLLIRKQDRDTSDAVMRELGFERMIDNHAVWSYFCRDMLVEIHDHMFYEYLVSDVDYRAYFDRAWEHALPELDPSFHFLYLIAHLAKHTINQGMGFRGFLDLVFFCRGENGRLRWDWICAELEKLKLLRFTETCFALCRMWFGFEPPIPVDELEDGFAAFVTEKMFLDGIFGFGNDQNKGSRAAKEITHDGAPYWIGALNVARRRLFPPYEDMQLIPWYSFVDGRPWLLPAAWVYRWGYCLAHKRRKGKAKLTEAFVKKASIEERQRLISGWGL